MLKKISSRTTSVVVAIGALLLAVFIITAFVNLLQGNVDQMAEFIYSAFAVLMGMVFIVVVDDSIQKSYPLPAKQSK